MPFEMWLQARGKHSASLTAEERVTLEAEWRAEVGGSLKPIVESVSDSSSPLASNVADSVSAEVRRIGAVVAACTDAGLPTIDFQREDGTIVRTSLGEAAVLCGWSVLEVERVLASARALGQLGPGAHLGGPYRNQVDAG